MKDGQIVFQVDGQVHQMIHMHRDMALSQRETILHFPRTGLVLLANNITAEGLSKSRSKSINHWFILYKLVYG